MEFSELIKDYLDDAETHLSAFDGALMAIEKDNYTKDTITGTLGSLHTLKGNSGMMGFDSLKSYIHQVEDVLKKVLGEELEIDKVMDALLDSANVIRGALMEIEKNPDTQPDLTEGIINLRGAVESGGKDIRQQAVSVETYLGAKTNTIKVDFKKLDDLLDLIGELVIFKTRLNQIEGRIKAALSDKPLNRELNEGLQLMGKAVSSLQEEIMKVRMLPVKTVFSRFPKMVRDIARTQGKQVEIVFQGGEIELDKTVIDALAEPLLHIARNAIDHGIEPPDVRLAKGKSQAGRITMSASHESNYVIIKVTDDGKGITSEKIREKAVKAGLLNEEDSVDGNELLNMIFSAGFSTNENATELSGRGVGLDIVSRNISKLNGQVMVESIPDKGCAFTIKLPLSLAIIPALMAETEGDIYAIPMSAVDESVKVKEEDIHIINNREIVRLRGQVLPVIRLSRFFNLEERKSRVLYLVVVGRAGKKIAIAVDRLRGQQEIVIKPLDDTFGKSKGIAGASILGDGRIVLIIDVLAFWARHRSVSAIGETWES